MKMKITLDGVGYLILLFFLVEYCFKPKNKKRLVFYIKNLILVVLALIKVKLSFRKKKKNLILVVTMFIYKFS